MDYSQATDINAAANAAAKNSADPFASDIFADPKLKAHFKSDDAARSQAESEKQWIWRLPKAARSTVDWHKLLQNLPADFSDRLPRLLADALTKLLISTDQKTVDFLFSDHFETNKQPDGNKDSWRLNVGIENSDAEFFIEIDDSFAVWLVDAALGEEISDAGRTRDLTASEIVVLEFLAVNLTAAANKIINAPLFKWRSLGQNISVSPNRQIAAESASETSFPKIISSWQIVCQSRQTIAKIHFTPEALSAMRADTNNLLTAAPRRAALWERLEKRVKNVRTRLYCGAARLTLEEIAGLEKDDVILLENYDFSFDKDGFYGSSKIFFGDGGKTVINVLFESPETQSAFEVEEKSADADNKYPIEKIKYRRVLRVLIESVAELQIPKFAEELMPEETPGLADTANQPPPDELNEAGGVPLETLAVNLRVELETRRLTLAEVGHLRVNQVIELGARATDAVNLLIGDKIIARGELVEVEDQLGVRIIQILR